MATVEISQVGNTFTTSVTEGGLRATFDGTLKDGTRVQVWRREEQPSGASAWRYVGLGEWSESGSAIRDLEYGPELEGAVSDLESALLDREDVDPSKPPERTWADMTREEKLAEFRRWVAEELQRCGGKPESLAITLRHAIHPHGYDLVREFSAICAEAVGEQVDAEGLWPTGARGELWVRTWRERLARPGEWLRVEARNPHGSMARDTCKVTLSWWGLPDSDAQPLPADVRQEAETRGVEFDGLYGTYSSFTGTRFDTLAGPRTASGFRDWLREHGYPVVA